MGPVQVGPYVLLRDLARGAMGVVYEAQTPDGARVALKVLAHAPSPDALARFDRERRLLAELTGAEGFVPLLDAGEQQGRPWFAMALLQGGSLRDRLRRGPLEAEAAVELARRLGLAIGRAHARGIVHRDLKPENILFEREGEGAAPWIADLGVARHFRETWDGKQSAALSRSGALLGTACYMAPEQLDDARRAGPPADVFALGQLLYECLTGATPFAGASTQETLVALAEGRYRPVRERAPGAPPWLEGVLARALEADPARRLQDGEAFARALAQGPFAAAAAGARARRRRLAGGAVGVAALAVAGAVGAVLLARRPPAPPAPAPPAPEAPAPPTEAVAPSAVELPVPEAPAAEVAPTTEAEPTTADGWVRRGVKCSADGRHDEAVDAYRRAIVLSPRRTTRVVLGFELIRAGRLDEAVAEADQLLAQSVDPAALNMRGTALVEKRHLRGLADLERSLQKLPRQANTLATLAVGLVRAHDWARAREVAERSLAEHERPGEALRSRGLARVALGDAAGGRADLERVRSALAPAAAALDAELQAGLARVGAPTDPPPEAAAEAARCVEEAWLAQARREVAASRRLVARALALAPDHAPALALLGSATPGPEGLARLERALARGPVEGWMLVERARRRTEAGDHAGAAEDYARAIAQDGPQPDFLLWRAEALLLARDPGALAAAQELTDRAPARAAGWLLLSQAHRARGDAEGALAAARRATEAEPRAVGGWRELGQVLLLLRRWEEAASAYERLLTLRPDDPLGVAGRSVVLANLGRAREALPDLERVAAANPAHDSTWVALAACRAAAGDAPGAAGAAGHVLARAPGNADALRLRALALGDVGDLPGARADLDALRRVAPGSIERDPKLHALAQKVR